MKLKYADKFFAYARERYEILLRRQEGAAPPWTSDPILGAYRFCNVFREDDKVTRWVKENLRDPLNNQPLSIPVLCAARFINRIETLQALLPDLVERGWDGRFAGNVLRALRKAGQPVVTGAYMIRTPFGMDKIRGLNVILSPIQRDALKLYRAMRAGRTLESAHRTLTEYKYMGLFMAYEVITDLRHTGLLNEAPDIWRWANAGPGAARGLSRVEFGEIGHFRYSTAGQEELNQGMRELLRVVHDFWPEKWPTWEMRDVEHTLCEYDKYERARLGQGRPKQVYAPIIRP